MCVTCGCSAEESVRLTDPVTGEIIELESDPAGQRPHQHTDASGRTYTHTHGPSAAAATPSGKPGDREQR